MKVHILPTGFTPEVFTDSASAISREGADRIISLHMPFKNKAASEKVEKTIAEIGKVFGKEKIERRTVRSDSFSGLVVELIGLLRSFSPQDRLFLHLGGGERHLGLALVYASFFVDRSIVLIPVLEYGLENGCKFKYEELPPLVPMKPTTSQQKTLAKLSEDRGMKLKDIIGGKTPGEYSSAAPSTLRNLKNLMLLHLVSFDPGIKAYRATKLAGFFLAMGKRCTE